MLVWLLDVIASIVKLGIVVGTYSALHLSASCFVFHSCYFSFVCSRTQSDWTGLFGGGKNVGGGCFIVHSEFSSVGR